MAETTMRTFSPMIREKNALRFTGPLRPDHPNQGAPTSSEHIIAAFYLSKNPSAFAQSKLQPLQRAIQPPPSA
jgi:hypothetical protein